MEQKMTILLLTVAALIANFAITDGARHTSFHSSDNAVHTFRISGDFDFDLSRSVKKRSLLRHFTKRDAGSSDGVCEAQEKIITQEIERAVKQKDQFLHKKTFDNETKYTMSLVWTGKDSLMVAVMEEMLMLAKQSSLYRSTDNGFTFESIIDRIDNGIIRKDNGMQKHPFRENNVFLVCHTSQPHSVLYITTNGGVDFMKVELPFLLAGHIMFYPDPECQLCQDWMLAHEQHTKDLYYSNNGGKNWQILDGGSNVVNFKWGSHKKEDSGTIYATFEKRSSLFDSIFSSSLFSPQNSGDLTLKKTSNFGKSWTTLLEEKVFTFGMEGKFLYASVKAQEEDKRLMHVSTDGGKTWKEAQLPTLTKDRFYSILDMSEGLIFMHVDNPGDTGHGTLYTSDGTGIVFSESLHKHLYPNYQEVTDFYKVNSMRGVYLASQMEEDNSIHTMITFNRGGEWRPITRPLGAPCKDESKACYLQIANLYSIGRGVKAQPPLSASSAVGIIMVHGHVAEALQTTPPDVYVSSDGGYSWIKSLDGPHHYQIADHGGLLVAVPADTPTPNIVKFSTDEGRCWHEYKFTDEEVVLTGLLTEPGNKAGSVGIWGFGKADRKWRVHVIDFSKIITKECGSTDFEDWIAHSDLNHEKDQRFHGCLLGVKETFKRLKKDSFCIHGYSFERTSSAVSCECSQEDYECDYGYRRKINSYICEPDEKFTTTELDVCIGGHEEKIVSQGYRKIAGDKCKGGFKPNAKEIDLNKACQDGDKSVVNKELVHPEHSQDSGHSDRMGVVVAIIVVVLLLALVLFVYFIRKYNLLSRRVPAYKYSLLSQTQTAMSDDYDNDFENTLATGTSIYEDSSDDESRRRERNPVNLANHRDHGSTQQNGHVLSTKPTAKPDNPEVKQYHDDSDVDLIA